MDWRGGKGRGGGGLIYAFLLRLSGLLVSIIVKQSPSPQKEGEFNYDENIVPDPRGIVAVEKGWAQS